MTAAHQPENIIGYYSFPSLTVRQIYEPTKIVHIGYGAVLFNAFSFRGYKVAGGGRGGRGKDNHSPSTTAQVKKTVGLYL